VVDVVDLNTWIADVADVLATPGLTEHAFSAGSVDPLEVPADAFGLCVVNLHLENPLLALSLCNLQLPQSVSWRGVDMSGIEYTIVREVPEGVLHIVASFIVRNPVGLASNPPGLVFAIEVDGVVYYECTTGGVDTSANLIETAVGVVVSGGEYPVVVDTGSGPGVRAEYTSLTCSATVRVSAGTHQMRLVYRNIAPADADNGEQVVSNGELSMFWSKS
jgi:hypothetical protein